MRIRLADASLLSDLCDYLSLQGYVAVEASGTRARPPQQMVENRRLVIRLRVSHVYGLIVDPPPRT